MTDLQRLQKVLAAAGVASRRKSEEIIVEGKRIRIKVNGETVVDFTEEPDRKPGQGFTRILDKDGGTFAFQAHDPKSEVHFRNIRAKKLP